MVVGVCPVHLGPALVKYVDQLQHAFMWILDSTLHECWPTFKPYVSWTCYDSILNAIHGSQDHRLLTNSMNLQYEPPPFVQCTNMPFIFLHHIRGKDINMRHTSCARVRSMCRCDVMVSSHRSTYGAGELGRWCTLSLNSYAYMHTVYHIHATRHNESTTQQHIVAGAESIYAPQDYNI